VAGGQPRSRTARELPLCGVSEDRPARTRGTAKIEHSERSSRANGARQVAKKKLAAIVKIQIPAGQATPAPPVGTALGPHGINIMDFCKAYNAATENQRGQIIPAEISIFEDRSFAVQRLFACHRLGP